VHEYYVMHWLMINDWPMIVVDDHLLINDWLLTVHDNFCLWWLFLMMPVVFYVLAIGTRTTRWLNLSIHLRLHHLDYNNVRTFLDFDDVKA
jgi:hypothetical protein